MARPRKRDKWAERTQMGCWILWATQHCGPKNFIPVFLGWGKSLYLATPCTTISALSTKILRFSGPIIILTPWRIVFINLLVGLTFSRVQHILIFKVCILRSDRLVFWDLHIYYWRFLNWVGMRVYVYDPFEDKKKDLSFHSDHG